MDDSQKNALLFADAGTDGRSAGQIYPVDAGVISLFKRGYKGEIFIFSTIPFEHETIPDEKRLSGKIYSIITLEIHFFNAVVRSLLCKENELIRYKPGFDMDSCDAGILVHANSIRNGTAEWFENDYQTIKNSKIPFVLVSVGSDSDSNFETHLEENVIRSIYRCYSLILERVPSIGVRGDMTKRFLWNRLEFPRTGLT